MAKAPKKRKKSSSAGRRKPRSAPGPAAGSGRAGVRAQPASARRRINVVYASSELAPFAKTGGLADVAVALPAALSAGGADVTVMLPLYRRVRESGVELKPLAVPHMSVPLGPYSVKVGLEGGELAGGRGRLVCLRYDPYFDRAGLYGEGGCDYPDNAQRFSLFSRGVIAAARALGLRPQVFHVNDWQTSLVCAYVRTLESGWASGMKTLLTIHNIGYQGRFWKWDLPWTGLDWSLFNPEAVEFYDSVNFLKAGIVFADAVTTVSPTYAREIQSSADRGMGMEGALGKRGRDIHGILNGVDRSVWDPRTDPHIPANYSAKDLAGKAKCKAALQRKLGLPRKARAPLLASIGRIAEQKGTGLILGAAEDLLSLEPDCQIVVLGTGDAEIARGLKELESRRPRNVAARITYDDALAHRIEAGADIFLMPSLYEPCGLSQLYSMIYGTVPVVRRTGGLADTVEDSVGPGTGTGFVFDRFAPGAFVEAARRAVARYRDAAAWRDVMRRAMAGTWSWESSASEYEALYRKMLTRR